MPDTLTVEVNDPEPVVHSKIMIINIPDYDWFMEEELEGITSILRFGQRAIDNALFIGIVGKDLACSSRKHIVDNFFNHAARDWTKLRRYADASVDDENGGSDSSGPAAPLTTPSDDANSSQELQLGVSAEGPAADDDATSKTSSQKGGASISGNEDLEPRTDGPLR